MIYIKIAPEIMSINENSKVQKDIHKYFYGKDASDEKTNKLVFIWTDDFKWYYGRMSKSR